MERELRPPVPLDAERVAAFIDGRLDVESRAAVAAQLAADPEWRELLADAAAVAEAAGSPKQDAPQLTVARATPTTSDTRVVGTGARGVPRAVWVVSALAAAALVVVVLRPRAGSVGYRSAAWVIDPGAAVAVGSEPSDSAMLGQRWTVMRAGSIELSVRAQGVRLGVLAVDAMSALRLNPDSLASVRAQMLVLLEATRGSGPVAGVLRSASDSATLSDALHSIRGLVDSAAFDTGVWLQLALLSAQRLSSSDVTRSVVVPAAVRSGLGADAQTVAAIGVVERGGVPRAEGIAQLRAMLARVAE
jgi:hypothetical protein